MGCVDDRVSSDRTADRWHAIAVNRAPEEVAPEGQLPGPLSELGEQIEVRLQPAPGERGTEIKGYFKYKIDGCVRVIFQPEANGSN